MSLAASRTLCRVLSRQTAVPSNVVNVYSSTLTHSACGCSYRAETKKKKVDPRKEQMVPPELTPIDDFITPAKYILLYPVPVAQFVFLSTLPCYEQTQHRVEMEAVGLAVEAQRDALEELEPNPLLFPFNHQGSSFTRQIHHHQMCVRCNVTFIYLIGLNTACK
uniref:Uncharacterized protein n=1 Tax=Hucho hucho TaxID=62062 RepID=A0A4W5R5Z5_9TELE